MLSEKNIRNIQRALKNGSCLVFLGEDLFRCDDGRLVSVAFAEQLVRKYLVPQKVAFDEASRQNLPYIAQRCTSSVDIWPAEIPEEMKEFVAANVRQPTRAHRLAAQLSARLFVSATPDSLTHLGSIYEIAHDTLVPPILQSRERRVQAEAAKIRKARRRAIIIGLIAGLLVLGAVVAGLWALGESPKAWRAEENARVASAKAERLAKEASAAETKADIKDKAALANFKEAKKATKAAAAALAEANKQKGIAANEKKQAKENYDNAVAKEKEAQVLLEKRVKNRNKQADALYLEAENYDSALVVLLEIATLSALEEETALRLLEVGWLLNASGKTGLALKAAREVQQLLGTALTLPAQVDSFGYPNAQLAQALIDLCPKHAIDWQDPQINMVTVPRGIFEMGSEKGEDDEKPVHSVTLSDYRIGETEVTQRQWLAVMGENRAYFQPKEGKAECLDCPVEQVSWWDVQRFVFRTSLVMGRLYRLPTEAEWEYAAREGGKKVLYGNGKNIADPAEMNFHASAEFDTVIVLDDVTYEEKFKLIPTRFLNEYSVAGEYRGKTTPVKTFPANALGLYDMSGNVWEWCQDWYGDYPDGPQTDPKDPNTGSYRVFRGGGWGDDPKFCRVANRGNAAPADRDGNLGFRLASQ